MIFSPSKALDIKERAELMEVLATDIRMGRLQTAKALGTYTNWLAQRIKSHDYRDDDLVLRRYPHKPLA